VKTKLARVEDYEKVSTELDERIAGIKRELGIG
jgi:hypothetical protein